jgi:hypothetical protein
VTPISRIDNPARLASARISTSNAKPSTVRYGQIALTALALNSLKPHCVSLMPLTMKARTNQLKARPMA